MTTKHVSLLLIGFLLSLCALAISPQHLADTQVILKFREAIQNKQYDKIVDFFLEHSNSMSSLYSIQKALFLTRNLPTKFLTRYTHTTDSKPDIIFFNLIYDGMVRDFHFKVWVDFAYKDKMPQDIKTNVKFLDSNKTSVTFEEGHTFLDYKEKMFNVSGYTAQNPVGLVSLSWGDRNRDRYDNQYHIVFSALPRWFYFMHDYIQFKYVNGKIVIKSELVDRSIIKGKMLIQSNLGYLNRLHAYHTINYESLEDLNAQIKQFSHTCDNRCNEVNVMTIYNIIEVTDAPIPLVITYRYEFKISY